MSAQAIAQTHLDAPNLFRPNDRDLEILPIRSYSQLSVATSYSHYQHIYTLSRCRTIVHSTSRQSNNICTRPNRPSAHAPLHKGGTLARAAAF